MTRVFCSHSVVNDLSAFRLPLNTAGRPATRVFHRPSIGSVGPPGSVRPLPICNSVFFRCDLGLLVSQESGRGSTPLIRRMNDFPLPAFSLASRVSLSARRSKSSSDSPG